MSRYQSGVSDAEAEELTKEFIELVRNVPIHRVIRAMNCCTSGASFVTGCSKSLMARTWAKKDSYPINRERFKELIAAEPRVTSAEQEAQLKRDVRRAVNMLEYRLEDDGYEASPESIAKRWRRLSSDVVAGAMAVFEGNVQNAKKSLRCATLDLARAEDTLGLAKRVQRCLDDCTE